MQGSRFQLANTDAVAWLKSLPSESIDLVVTDPPYESLEKHRAIGTTTRLKNSKASSNAWFEIFPNTRFPDLFAEVHRVLKDDRHFYLYCDPETMFVAKPLGEAAGFKFWKPIIWDKCLGPDTLVWTNRGTVRMADIEVGDRVALPNGGSANVLATRRTKAPAVRLELSDGTFVVASREHRFVRASGELANADDLRVDDALAERPVRLPPQKSLSLDDIIPLADAVHELPATETCLWCGATFDSFRAASAHQARWCSAATSKAALAKDLGVRAKRLRWWMGQGRMPRSWARSLGIEGRLGDRVQCVFQNDSETWYPRSIPLDYELGKVLGLYAAEGSMDQVGVTFAFHAHEKHLHAFVARFARSLGLRARVYIDGAKAVVNVNFKLMGYLVSHFVEGTSIDKRFTPALYAGDDEFIRGVLDGLLEGDGHWSHDEQRQYFTSASNDLVMFVRRELAARGATPKWRRVDNDGAGAGVVRYDPIKRANGTFVAATEDVGERELVDISIDHPDELFLLANGVVTHNCKIGMGYHYRARYECILFFEKGKRKLNDLGIPDVLAHDRVFNGYPAEKPTAISKILIEQSTQPGEVVIDPFMGSGSAGVAAIECGRHFMGNDLCAEAVAITRERSIASGALEGPLEQEPERSGQLGLMI